MKRLLISFILCFIGVAAAFAQANESNTGLVNYPVFLDKEVDLGLVKAFQSKDNPNQFYYLPSYVRIKRDPVSDALMVGFQQYVRNEKSAADDENTNDKGSGGGFFWMTVGFSLTSEELSQCNQRLQQLRPGAALVGSMAYESGTCALITFGMEKDEENNSSTQILGVGKAPLMEGDAISIGIILNAENATKLYATLRLPNPNVQINFDMNFRGFSSPVKAKIEMNYDKIANDKQMSAALQVPKLGFEIDKLSKELIDNKSINIITEGDLSPNDETLVKEMTDKFKETFFEPLDNTNDILQDQIGGKSAMEKLNSYKEGYQGSKQWIGTHFNFTEDYKTYINTKNHKLFNEKISGLIDCILLRMHMYNKDLEYKGLFASIIKAKEDPYGNIENDYRKARESFNSGDYSGASRKYNTLYGDSKYGIFLYNAGISSACKFYCADKGTDLRLIQPFLGEATDYLNSFKSGISTFKNSSLDIDWSKYEDMAKGVITDVAKKQAELNSTLNKKIPETAPDKKVDDLESLRTECDNLLFSIAHLDFRDKTPRLTAEEKNKVLEEYSEKSKQFEYASDLGRATMFKSLFDKSGFYPFLFNAGSTYISNIIYNEDLPISTLEKRAALANEYLTLFITSPANNYGILNDEVKMIKFRFNKYFDALKLSKAKSDFKPNTKKPSSIKTKTKNPSSPNSAGENSSVLSTDNTSPVSSPSDPSINAAATTQLPDTPRVDTPTTVITSTPTSSPTTPDTPNTTVPLVPSESMQLGSKNGEGETSSTGQSALDSKVGTMGGDLMEPESTKGQEVETTKDDNTPKEEEKPKKSVMDVINSIPVSAYLGYKAKKITSKGTKIFELNRVRPATRSRAIAFSLPRIPRSNIQQINLDDPLYAQREVIALLDGNIINDFPKYINFVNISIRKRHPLGDLSLPEQVVDRNNFNKYSNRFKLMYGWRPGDNDRRTWMDYEYKTVWSFHGGAQIASDWTASNQAVIALTSPCKLREIKLMGEIQTLKERQCRLVQVKLYSSVGGVERVETKSFNIARLESLEDALKILVPAHIPNFQYEIRWTLSGNRTLTSGKINSEADELFIDEIPN